MTRRRLAQKTLIYLFLSVSGFVMLCPVLYVFLAAFTTDDNFLNAGVLPIPNTLNLAQWAAAWEGVHAAVLLTLIRVSFYLVLSLLAGTIGGYIFSRLRFPGRNLAFLMVLMGMVMPAILMVVPQFIQTARWPLAGGNDIWGQGGHGFIGEWPVLFMYGWVPPLGIFLLKQTFDMLPTEYEDAAKLDGAGLLTIIFRVYGPLLRPAQAALIVITFLSVWNDYLWPNLTVVGHPDLYPVAFILNAPLSVNLSGAFIVVLMILVPPALVFLVFQRYFVQGLVASGLKG